MRVIVFIAFAFVAFASVKAIEPDVTELQIESTFKPDTCEEAHKAASGDQISVHYT